MKICHVRGTELFRNMLSAIALAAVLCGGSATGMAQESGAGIPDALKPWKAWVMYGQEAWLCPEVAGMRKIGFCAWPGELKLDMREGGIQFSQTWDMRREGAAPLPGGREYWPQQVMVDGRPHPVLVRGNGGQNEERADDIPGDAPVVWLTPGRHTVSGWIPWLERPRELPVPKNVALISLSAGGKAVLMLERSETSLILGGGAGEAPPEGAREDDSLDVQVYRKLSDGIPARLTTRVYLKVSGKPRELSVADIMPEHFMPTGMASAWAARLDQDGRLLVQALPGQATVEIAARLDEPLREVKPSLPPQRPQEVWSYEAAPALRTTTVPSGDGMIAVDPRQAGVPADWLSLPALAVSEGARFRVEEHARGQDERENQRLTLQREMWLDFSGKGFFARDRIEGSMRQGWRFDVAQPYALVRADSLVARASSTQASWGGRQLASNALGAEEGLMAALLVTQGADKGLTGVEWRQPQVTLNAGVRLEAGPFARIPVTGWRQTFDEVDVGLYLPYGYHLIAAPGVDKVSSNVWVERWTMLDIFLVAFFTLLSWRLFGVKGGVSAAAYLILAMSAQAAPMQSFAVAVAFVLLHRLTPEGRLRRLFCIGQYLALLGLVVAALAFIPVQIRYALYPQLEEGSGGMAAMPWNAGFGAKDRVIMTPTYDADEIVQPTLAPAAPEDAGESDDQAEYLSKSQRALPGLRSAESSKQMMGHASARQRYIQSTVTQTGGGEPAWSLGQRYSLHWSGPVAVAQDVRLLISPPWLTRFLRVTTVVLLALLIWRLVYAVFPGSMPPPKWPEKFRIVIPPRFFPRRSSAKAALLAGMALAVLFAAALGFSSPAAAEPASGFPSEELLDELKMRLTEAPACSPSCVDVAEARIEAEPRVFRVTLSAHAAAPSTLPLPEPGGHLSLRGVRVDGVAQSVLRFKGENYLALHTGVRRIQIEYVPVGDTASLSFPLLPARVEFAGTGWHAEGIDESRLLSETLNFSRSENAPAPLGGSGTDEVANPAQTQQFSPFVHVQRNIDFDLDWSVTTEVRRIAPVEGGFAFPIPLLAGEHVTTSSVKVQDGRVLAVLAANAASVSWSARLDKAETLELLAPPLSERAETWFVTVNPSWHLEWNGVPVMLAGVGEDQAVFVFHPLPGEKLTLAVTRPAKVDGSFLAIDRVSLKSDIGRHASDYRLEFTLRASRGGEHGIGLPPELEVLEVLHDGVLLNLQARENRLSLPVSPGVQAYVLRLRAQEDVGLITASPAIDLGLPAANIALNAALGEQRWVMATGGPDVGPAVLYWGELLVALAAAFLFARTKWCSLHRRECFLLVLGFSTFSWLALLYIALWLIVIDWRARTDACASWPAWKFNFMQTGIVVLTVAMLTRLIDAVPAGLLSIPDMGISGNGSSAGQLSWFADQAGPLLPVGWIISLPVWVYRLLMLAWALWLAYILIRWLGRGFAAWLRYGYWKNISWKGAAAKETPSEDTEKST